MTSTTDRRPLGRPESPTRRTAGSPRAPRPAAGGGSPVLSGLIAAVWALGAGFVTVTLPVLLVWAADARSGTGAAAAVRTAAQFWLVAHGTALHLPSGTFDLTPLGLLALPLALLWRAGRHAARSTHTTEVRAAARLLAAVAGPYALGVAVVGALAAGGGVQPAPVQALLGGAVVAVLGAGAGVLRECGCVRELVERVHPRVRGLSLGTAAAGAVLLCGGALLAGASLAVHLSQAGALARSAQPGLAGGLGLLLLGIAFVPNAALWGVAWLTGPGFAVGVGTTVGPFGTVLGPVPALPLLAALPSGAPPTWLGVCALALPVLAGVVAGLVVAPRLAAGWLHAAGEAALLGPCVAVAVGLLAALSGGPAAAHRLAAVGPSPWRVGLAAGLEVMVGAAVTTAVLVRRRP